MPDDRFDVDLRWPAESQRPSRLKPRERDGRGPGPSPERATAGRSTSRIRLRAVNGASSRSAAELARDVAELRALVSALGRRVEHLEDRLEVAVADVDLQRDTD